MEKVAKSVKDDPCRKIHDRVFQRIIWVTNLQCDQERTIHVDAKVSSVWPIARVCIVVLIPSGRARSRWKLMLMRVLRMRMLLVLLVLV
jgi:hypothetical protein